MPRWAPRRWDPFSVQAGVGSFCCSAIWKIGSSVREATIFSAGKQGWPGHRGAGVEADGQAQGFTHAVRPGQQGGGQQKIPLSRFADSPDRSGTEERRHAPMPWPPMSVRSRSRRFFTVSSLQSDANSKGRIRATLQLAGSRERIAARLAEAGESH